MHSPASVVGLPVVPAPAAASTSASIYSLPRGVEVVGPSVAADPNTRQLQNTIRIHQRLRGMCRKANIDPDSNSGLMFAQAFTLGRISQLSARVQALESGRPQEIATSRTVVSLPKVPLLETKEELDDFHLDDTVINWIDTVGGNSAKDHVQRVLNGLLGHYLQTQINRTGTFGKLKFSVEIENLVSESYRKLFPPRNSRFC